MGCASLSGRCLLHRYTPVTRIFDISDNDLSGRRQSSWLAVLAAQRRHSTQATLQLPDRFSIPRLFPVTSTTHHGVLLSLLSCTIAAQAPSPRG